MEKLTVVGNFTKSVEMLRNTECSRKDKLNHFHNIYECILSPSMTSHVNYAKHCSSAISVLLFFCEDLDSIIRMNAEENLNKIIRSLEATRVSRVLLDLFSEIRKNGNERSLRICLNLFAHYCPRIKEKNLKWYALKIIPCLQAIATRKETLLNETLCEFVKSFSKYLLICLNVNETCKLMEVFLTSMISECAVKRRCSSQNCISLIENSTNKIAVAKYGLKKTFDLLINDQQTTAMYLGVLGFLRLLLPIIISESICDCKQIIEIYDFCLLMLNNHNHSIVNASLEVINSILSQRNGALEELFTSHQLHHNEFLKKRKSLKNQIFQLKIPEMTCTALGQAAFTEVDAFTLNKHQPSRKSTSETVKDAFKSESPDNQNTSEDKGNVEMRFEISELEESSKCNKFFASETSNIRDSGDSDSNCAHDNVEIDDKELTKGFISVLEANEPQHCSQLSVERVEDKLQLLSDIDNESFNSIDFESEITIGEQGVKIPKRDEKDAEIKSQKSTDSIGSFISTIYSNAETMTKLFRPSTKLSGTATDSPTTSTPKTKHSDEKRVSRQPVQSSTMAASATTTTTITTATGVMSNPTVLNVAGTQTLEDDTISLESINSHISLGSHVSFQSSSQDLLRNEQDLVLVQTNDYENEKNVEILGESVPPEVVDVQQETKESAAGSATILLARSKNEHEKLKGVSILENFSSNENKFSSDYSSNEINIGTIYDQPLLYYTTRLIASKFLLAGVPGKLSSDSIARVSIKNLSLNVIANCVKITPDILRLSLEIDKSEISSKIQVDTSPEASNDSSSNEIGNDFDITEQIGEDAAYINLTNISNINTPCTSQPLEDNLLEMKDDHFGESNTTFYLNSPLSKSADPVLVTELKGASLFINKEQSNTGESCKLNQQLERILSKSEIIESDSFRKQNETKGHFTSSPSATPAPSVAASPSVLFSEKSNSNDLFQQQQREFHQQKQFVYDVLLFHQHPDPILRGDVQIIVGNFIGGSLLISGKNDFDGPFDMNRLLAICMKGFRDEIHTVVIQALSTFDRIFSLLMLNHFSVLCKQIESYQVGDDDDDEQFIENLLGTQFDVDQEKQKEIGKFSERYHLKNISAKLLLNQLCLCYDNKYWLVQNKYSEVISNLDYETIRELYGDDIASSYEATFVRQLLHLLGDDDTRVRDNTAESICRYIQTRYQKTLEIGTCYTNLNLLRDFLDHRIFHGMPKYLRYLFNDETKISIESANVLSKVLYLGTNELMELHNKNSQFGIINAIKVLLNNFNPVDYYDAWNEFNVVEVCLKFTYQNYITATDLNCQNDLIEITSKLLSANMLSGKINNDFLDSLLTHIMKILNIYFHLFSNRNPILFPKTQKSDLFSSTKELAVMNSMGYFGNDYLYIRIFNTLKSAFESYKITINKESGAKLMSLVTTCLRSLAVLLEFKDHSKSTNIIKLIEEILQYLTVLINYEPVETIGCLRQLLKFLFGRNYANRRNNYENFTKLYFIARNLNISNMKFNKNENQGCTEENANNVKYNKILEEIFASAMCFPLGKIKSEEECAKHIKMFEPLVIYCLPFFMKSNSIVQAPILDLLTQLLEFNVTYSILDSKNVIFDQVMKNLELIESGVARNSDKIINSIIKFLVSLSKHGDNKLVSIPKIISIINNLLANNSIRECSVLALKGLAFEIFFNMTIPNHPDYGDSASLHAKELNTQKEVMLGMLEKFIGSLECQKTLSILLLWNKVRADVPSSIQEGTVYSIVTKGLVDDKIKLRNLESFFVLDSLFKNIDKSVLLDAIGFPALLSLFMTKKADNFNDLSYITIILDNVILNAEEIYLVNHIKLFMKNHQSSSSTNEINHFIKVLNEKLDTCLSTLIKCPHDNDFCLLVVKFVRNLWKISNWDAINSTFRRELTENFFYGKFCLTTSLSMEYLQVEILKALCEMNLDKISMLVQLQKFGKRTVRRALLKQVCRKFNNTRCWTDNEVQVLFSDEFLSIIVEDKFKLVQHLCEVPEFSTLILQRLLTISQNIKNGDIHFVIKVISRSDDHHLKVALLSKLRNTGGRDRVVEQLIERSMMEIPTGSYLDSDFCEKRRKSKTNMMDASDVDENWMINQVIQLSSTSHPEEYARILLDIKSELKLKSIFSAEDFNNKNVLRSCINTSFQSMIQAFQNDCIQYSPHINYMNMNSLAKISINTVIKNLATITVSEEKTYLPDDFLLMLPAVTVLMEKISELENIGLQYVEYKFVKKFVNENILKTTSIIEIFINAIIGCCIAAKRVLKSRNNQEKSLEIDTYFKCIDAILKQEIIWLEINQPEKYEWYLNMILDTVYYGMTKSIPNTIFLKRYKLQAFGYNSEDKSPNGNGENVDAIQKAIFIGKLIEAKIDTDPVARISSMNILNSVAITLLRTDKFYMYAVTPIEIFQSFVYDKPIRSNCKLPSIPVEHLSDVEILQKFVRRLSIFGFSARQQFEEFFMTFLLLINKVYDENMVDVQEQFQIKSTCLAAILELLIRCKTFPYVGNKLSQFHHTTRWSRIKCDSISLKKLHKIHLLLPGLNAFSLPNLERGLTPNTNNNIIGTNCFQPNQYSLNFIWHMMESFPVDDDVKVDTFNKNFRYFTEISEIDLTSSSQLIFDVLTQLLEQNHVLVLPNLVKFCEICDNRDQIKWINSRMLKLQESISIDDTISHQYIIYLLCKTQSILVPCYSDLSHLCSVISTYLRSSHVFIRNATLHGLLSLLECCSKTNTTIGKLSEELSLLRDLIVGYINRHGIIEESSALFSDIHTKLVWALNFSLVEMTTKFVPECHLLANSIISANNLLKRTTNEGVYLCILHGLERVIVIRGGSQAICDKIEKLALELVKLENERFCLPALKLLLSCMYIGSSKQLENTELSNGIVQDDPEIIAQQTEKVDVLLHCIKSSTSSAARIYGEVLCQIIRDLVPPNEILTKVIKEFLAINQPHCGVIARIVYQVFRSAIDSSFLHMLQDWLICSLPTFITLPEERGVWCLTVIFLSASINLHLIKLFPVVLYEFRKLDYAEISLFVTSAQDFHGKLNADQKKRFKEVFEQSDLNVYKIMMKTL